VASEVPVVVSRAQFDDAARQVITGLAPLNFDIARSAEDVDAVLRLRYRCVVEEGWAAPSSFPDGRERDEYDDVATLIMCRDGDEMAGCMRVIVPSPERLLPTEREFGIRARPQGMVVEAGRIIVAPGARIGRSHLVIAGLCARSWMAMSSLGYERALSTATPELIELYRGLGLQITVIGPSRMHWGEERAPIQIDGTVNSFRFLWAPGLTGP
jgi:N-acyl-L-homoserine lactone synthetase